MMRVDKTADELATGKANEEHLLHPHSVPNIMNYEDRQTKRVTLGNHMPW